MRSLRYSIEVKRGVEAAMLFTPHLYSFKGKSGITFEFEDDTAGIFEVYADIMYCAALNAWVLDGKGDVDDAPFTRGDFHAWMVAEPAAYQKAVKFAFEALSGKSLHETIINASNGPKTGKEAEDASKKKACTSLGMRWRRFWSGR